MGRKRFESGGEPGRGDAAVPEQRLDKWLWFARVARTRVLAAELAASGHVRVNGQRVAAAAKLVRRGDVLTIALNRRVLVLKVLEAAERRGAYVNARLLYEDLAPAADAAPARRDRLARVSQRR